MALGNFKVKPEDASIQRVLKRLRDSFEDLTEPLQNSAKELTKRVRQRFSTKRDPDGVKWKPWARTTAAKYKKSKRTLMLNTRALRDNTKFVASKKGLRAQIGTPYGANHEKPFGARTATKIPRRAFLFSTRNGGRALAQKDEAYLLNALRYQIRKLSR